LPSPKKMQLAADNSNLVEEVETSGDEHGKSFSKIFHKVSSTYIPTGKRKICTIADMPDPNGVYSSTLGHADLSKSWVEVPNVRDGNGTLIRPEEYDDKLTTGTIVMANVYMRL
jgi:hypothetical protein